MLFTYVSIMGKLMSNTTSFKFTWDTFKIHPRQKPPAFKIHPVKFENRLPIEGKG